eukprot:COSAG03_NODE_4953_length_1380_cov_1.230289_1_plen_37_part_10
MPRVDAEVVTDDDPPRPSGLRIAGVVLVLGSLAIITA